MRVIVYDVFGRWSWQLIDEKGDWIAAGRSYSRPKRAVRGAAEALGGQAYFTPPKGDDFWPTHFERSGAASTPPDADTPCILRPTGTGVVVRRERIPVEVRR